MSHYLSKKMLIRWFRSSTTPRESFISWNVNDFALCWYLFISWNVNDWAFLHAFCLCRLKYHYVNSHRRPVSRQTNVPSPPALHTLNKNEMLKYGQMQVPIADNFDLFVQRYYMIITKQMLNLFVSVDTCTDEKSFPVVINTIYSECALRILLISDLNFCPDSKISV